MVAATGEAVGDGGISVGALVTVVVGGTSVDAGKEITVRVGDFVGSRIIVGEDVPVAGRQAASDNRVPNKTLNKFSWKK
jgi:hypothetical protein